MPPRTRFQSSILYKNGWTHLAKHGLWLGLILTLLSACGTLQPQDGPPRGRVDVSKIPNAVPKVLPRSPYGNPPSYVVYGKRYYVRNSAQGFTERGVASWYGSKFHGLRTSSGEPYDMLGMTAAMRTLPLPTFVQVTNLQNHKQIIVKVNDRGPFKDNRIIDLSYAAAAKLDMLAHGTAFVEVRAIDPRTWSHESVRPHPQRHSAPPSYPTQPQLFLQVGAFSDKNNAEHIRTQLQTAIAQPSRIETTHTAAGQAVYRVQVGPLASAELSDQIAAQLEKAGFSGLMTVME